MPDNGDTLTIPHRDRFGSRRALRFCYGLLAATGIVLVLSGCGETPDWPSINATATTAAAASSENTIGLACPPDRVFVHIISGTTVFNECLKLRPENSTADLGPCIGGAQYNTSNGGHPDTGDQLDHQKMLVRENVGLCLEPPGQGIPTESQGEPAVIDVTPTAVSVAPAAPTVPPTPTFESTPTEPPPDSTDEPIESTITPAFEPPLEGDAMAGSGLEQEPEPETTATSQIIHTPVVEATLTHSPDRNSTPPQANEDLKYDTDPYEMSLEEVARMLLSFPGIAVVSLSVFMAATGVGFFRLVFLPDGGKRSLKITEYLLKPFDYAFALFRAGIKAGSSIISYIKR